MRQIVKDGQLFDRRVYESKDQAREELADEPYKLELVDDKSGDPDVMEVGGDELTAYDNLNPRTRERIWGDLCRGPHIPTTKYIPAFKLTRSSAAYWRGDQDNASLQRIYGTAWESQEALDRHLELIEEAQRRDHRKLGVELDLFSFPDEIGSGLPVFHPKGGIVRRELEDYSRRKHIEAGYEFVNTPHITKAQLFHTSGHLDWYADGMFPPMHIDAEFNEDGTVRKPGQDYYLKPMNCPMHCLIFRARGRSYRELPLRLFEFGAVYRYEKSGVVHGLTRVRGMTRTTRTSSAPASRCATSSPRCCGSCSTCSATTGSTTSTSSCRPRTRRSSSAPTRSGRKPPTRWPRWPPSPGWSW